MTKHRVSVSWFRAVVAVQAALLGLLLGLMAPRWPVAAGVVMAVAVCVVMWLAIYRIVTSGHQVKPVAPARDAAATVDGVPVKSVEVMS